MRFKIKDLSTWTSVLNWYNEERIEHRYIYIAPWGEPFFIHSITNRVANYYRHFFSNARLKGLKRSKICE